MAKIQQGDYLRAKPMVADTSDFSGVQNAIGGLVNTAQAVNEKANASKIANMSIELSNKALQLNNDINLKYQKDPTNPEREREFKEGFDLLAQEYKVNPFLDGKWGEIKNNIYNNYSQYNAKWQIQQQQTNAQNDLKNGYEELNNQISMLGKNGANYDEVRLIYENGINGLKNASVLSLGEVVTEQFLKDANHDFMTSYISSLAIDNPLKAQQLMQDDGVLNDIGNAETIEKLNDYINKSMFNQHSKTAMNELGNALRSLNSQDAQDLLNGKASITQLMRFNESNKYLPEESKEMLNNIYGIKSKNKYVYDSDKKRIIRSDEGEGLANLKLNDMQKRVLADTLETDLHSFLENPLNEINLKELKSEEQKEIAQERQVQFMNNIATMQGKIDMAFATGAIDKNTRNRLVEQFILPASEVVENNIQQLDEGNLFGKNLLGYDRIKKEFDLTDLKGQELKDRQQQKLMAQNYYLDGLYKVVKDTGLKSIYDIETELTKEQRQKVYEAVADNALVQAKRWTNKPEIFFQKEFPNLYEEPFKIFGQEKAIKINREVAEMVYKAKFDGDNRELIDIATTETGKAIRREALLKERKAGNILTKEKDKLFISKISSYEEFEKVLKDLDVTPEEFEDFAYMQGYVNKKNTASFYSTQYKHRYLKENYLNKQRLNALNDIIEAKAMKNKGE